MLILLLDLTDSTLIMWTFEWGGVVTKTAMPLGQPRSFASLRMTTALQDCRWTIPTQRNVPPGTRQPCWPLSAVCHVLYDDAAAEGSCMEWVQAYDPLGSALWSSLVAGSPIVVLLGLLVVGVSAPRAAAAGLATSLAVAIGVFRMPASAALASAACGGCFGLLPIGWIVFSAVFLYHLTVRTGQFEIVKRSVISISPDQRIQALLIAFSFGTFLEGAAGFGTPVAISAALLIGIGFSPLYAAGLALLANTSPVAFGALGTPILTLAKVSGIGEMALSQAAGRQLTLFSLIVPAWLVAVMSGWKGVKGCWPAILISGGSYAAVQFVMSNWHGPTLVTVVGGLVSLMAHGHLPAILAAERNLAIPGRNVRRRCWQI